MQHLSIDERTASVVHCRPLLQRPRFNMHSDIPTPNETSALTSLLLPQTLHPSPSRASLTASLARSIAVATTLSFHLRRWSHERQKHHGSAYRPTMHLSPCRADERLQSSTRHQCQKRRVTRATFVSQSALSRRNAHSSSAGHKPSSSGRKQSHRRYRQSLGHDSPFES